MEELISFLTYKIFIFNENETMHDLLEFIWILLIIYRSNAKGNTKADGYRWIDHLSCEESSAGAIDLLKYYCVLVWIFFLKSKFPFLFIICFSEI